MGHAPSKHRVCWCHVGKDETRFRSATFFQENYKELWERYTTLQNAGPGSFAEFAIVVRGTVDKLRSLTRPLDVLMGDSICNNCKIEFDNISYAVTIMHHDLRLRIDQSALAAHSIKFRLALFSIWGKRWTLKRRPKPTVVQMRSGKDYREVIGNKYLLKHSAKFGPALDDIYRKNWSLDDPARSKPIEVVDGRLDYLTDLVDSVHFGIE